MIKFLSTTYKLENENIKKYETEKEIKSENLFFKPTKPLKLGGSRNNDDLIQILTKKLAGMEVNDPFSSKNQVNFLSGTEKNSSISETYIQNIDDSEKEDDQINKLKTWHKISKKIYQRPTPLDLQFEERQPHQNSYNTNEIYSWNIDGFSEYEILVVLRQMQMAATAYLMEGDDHNAVQLLVTGFNGTLKFW